MREETPAQIEWDFEKVPDVELVACCYWEYARESAFIRNVRERCIENWRAGGNRPERLSADWNKLHSIGPEVEVLTRGIHFAPGEARVRDMQRDTLCTNSFPAPWQSLLEDERDFRVRVLLTAGWCPARAFERADLQDVLEIAEQIEGRWKEIFSEYDRVRRAYPEASEVQLVAKGKLKPWPGIPVSIFGTDGREATAVAINWAHFTNEEIVQAFRKWVKSNRPKKLCPSDRKGRNKARDWRVALERLAMMRLLHRFRLSEIEAKSAAAWKLYGKRDWYKERKRAGARFRGLFPFLAKSERPLSWPTTGGHSK